MLIALVSSCGQQRGTTEEANGEETYVFQPPAWSYNAVIYEVNVRQYTPEGTFKAFEAHLPRLKELGVEILWFMPVHPISEKNRKGPLGSYYAVQDYKKINPEFGTMDDFRSLVQEAHHMGFYVILDWVANHTGWDNPWIFDHPEWYTQDSTGNIIYPSDWTDVADLNYDNAGMRAAMIDALKFWVEEADIDGYRCDVAADVPTDFWNDARFELDRIKPVFMLAEAEKPEHHEKAFDMSYSWELHALFNDIAQGKKNATDLDNYYIKHDTTFPLSAYRMNFITNHDENSWHGSVNERMGEAGPAFAVLSYMLPGMPLIYSGQEVGLDKRLAFFSKDTINWDYESPLVSFYTTLNRMKKENEALWNGSHGGGMVKIRTTVDDKAFAFIRQKGENTVVVVTNLSDEKINIELSAEDIPAGQYTDAFSGAVVPMPGNNSMELAPWAYHVLVK